MLIVKEILVTLGIIFSLWLAGVIFGHGFSYGLKAGELKFKAKVTVTEEKVAGNEPDFEVKGPKLQYTSEGFAVNKQKKEA